MRATAETITDEQIAELRRAAMHCPFYGDFGHVHRGPSYNRKPCACGRAFPLAGHVVPDAELERNAMLQLTRRAFAGESLARGFCARAWNARRGDAS